MSMWTHITACLSVETFIQDDNILDIVQKYINKAPKITGSEGNANIFLNLPQGYNFWATGDCNKCPYASTRKPMKNGWFSCEVPDENYKCPENSYQTCVVISIQGDLRDRSKERTEKEFTKFLNYINKKYFIRDYAVNIEEGY